MTGCFKYHFVFKTTIGYVGSGFTWAGFQYRLMSGVFVTGLGHNCLEPLYYSLLFFLHLRGLGVLSKSHGVYKGQLPPV